MVMILHSYLILLMIMKKISYSSSFGMSEIPDEYLDCYKKYLSEIKHISTREIFGVKLIKQLTGRDAKLVMDPVFLLTKNPG